MRKTGGLNNIYITSDFIYWSQFIDGSNQIFRMPVGHTNHKNTEEIFQEEKIKTNINYGGGEFWASHNGFCFIRNNDQVVYCSTLEGQRIVLSMDPGLYALPKISPNGHFVSWIYRSKDQIDILQIYSLKKRALISSIRDHDFYGDYCWSHNSGQIAWISWDHPSMPWLKSLLTIGDVTPQGKIKNKKIVSEESAISQPIFSKDSSALFYCSDKDNWNHIYRFNLNSQSSVQLTYGECEFSGPVWTLDNYTYSELEENKILACYSIKGNMYLTFVSTEEKKETEKANIDFEYRSISQLRTSVCGSFAIVIGSSPEYQPALKVIDLSQELKKKSTDSSRVQKKSIDKMPIQLKWSTTDQQYSYGLYYPPILDSIKYEEAPVIVLIHGGPSSQVNACWPLKAKTYNNSGYGVFYVNYRGSSGYGKKYLTSIRHQWGIYDVDDAVTGLKHLKEKKLANIKRAIIWGGNAGGYTVLQALIRYPKTFKAGICVNGISDLVRMRKETHKFEAHYLDFLIGDLEETPESHQNRSPICNISRITAPLAIFQGAQNKLVSVSQSDILAKKLTDHQIPHIYHKYKNEGNSWQDTKTKEHYSAEVMKFLRKWI